MEPTPPPNNYGITERELIVLQMMVDGMCRKTIAAILGISERTIGAHVASIKVKLKAVSREQAAARAVDLNIVKPSPLDNEQIKPNC